MRTCPSLTSAQNVRMLLLFRGPHQVSCVLFSLFNMVFRLRTVNIQIAYQSEFVQDKIYKICSFLSAVRYRL